LEFLFAPQQGTNDNLINNNHTAALIHSIALFLTVSDAASLVTALMSFHGGGLAEADTVAGEAIVSPATGTAAPTPDSWAVGETLEESAYHNSGSTT
jgi:hypothetical protein